MGLSLFILGTGTITLVLI